MARIEGTSYSSELSEDRIRKDLSGQKIEFVYACVLLLPYFVDNQSDLVRWIACEKCIKDEVRHYFTRIPQGWKEEEGVWLEYEEMNQEGVEDRDTTT